MTGSSRQVLIVGIGSPHGDDSVGWYVARTLAERHPESEHVQVKVAQIPVDLINWLGDVRELHLIDACHISAAGPASGMISARGCHWHRHEITVDDLKTGTLPFEFRHEAGTHGWSLISVLQLAQRLHMLPQRLILWAIEADSFAPGTVLADSVRDAADLVAEQLRSVFDGDCQSTGRVFPYA